jgi:hypothetical protein
MAVADSEVKTSIIERIDPHFNHKMCKVVDKS